MPLSLRYATQRDDRRRTANASLSRPPSWLSCSTLAWRSAGLLPRTPQFLVSTATALALWAFHRTPQDVNGERAAAEATREDLSVRFTPTVTSLRVSQRSLSR